MKKFLRFFRLKKIRVKTSGAVLFLAVILSGLVVSAGAGVLRFLLAEHLAAVRLLSAERAYFAAESGVELALAALKESPVNSVESLEIPLFYSAANLDIQNKFQTRSEKTFTLSPGQTQKLRLQTDSNADLDFVPIPVSNFQFSFAPAEKISWKVICRNDSSETISLQNTSEIGAVNSGASLVGTADLASGSQSTALFSSFYSPLSETEKNTCFLSVSNLSDSDLVFDFSATLTLPPPKSKVKSVGTAGGAEKRIVFFYSQNALSSFFDFGLLQRD